MGRRTGRRPGKQDTRQAILAAAAEVFAEHGFDQATIRQIAAGAGVDPALVHHYFGSKEQLFLATVRPPIEPAVLVPQLLSGELGGLGERIVGTFLAIWEHPVSGPAFAALLRSAVTGPVPASLIREFFAVQIVRRIINELGARIDPVEIPLRATLVASQLFGLAVIRHVLKFEPLASTPRETVTAAVAPTVQRYLTGELPPANTDPAG